MSDKNTFNTIRIWNQIHLAQIKSRLDTISFKAAVEHYLFIEVCITRPEDTFELEINNHTITVTLDYDNSNT